jgi:hAT family C-terminal dimerisation region
MLTPKHASDGFYLYKLEVFEPVKNYVELRYPYQKLRTERKMIKFNVRMSDLPTSITKIFSRYEFPTLYLYAKQINSMICSSASSEKAWNIFLFWHNRLRNRLSKVKVEQLVYVCTNSSIIEEMWRL